jgi:hypothetical protein
MRIICCHSHKGPYTSLEAIVQCAECKGCWHKACLDILAKGNCCNGEVYEVAKDYVDFEQRGLGAA